MRRKRLSGIRYNFLIEFDTLEKCYIDIWAKHRQTKQISPIANLNTVISEIKPDNDHSQFYYDSTWILKDKLKAENIYKELIVLLRSKIFLKYLENKLDEDRLLGGWNSYFSF